MQRLQNRCARAVSGIFDFSASVMLIIKRLGWMNISERFKYFTSCLMFKCLNEQAPFSLCEKFTYLSDSQSYSTRSARSGLLKIPRFHVSAYKKSFAYNGATTWNNLPANLRSCSSLIAFKNVYKTADV